MATLKDIAAEVGVSIRTVSRALRDSGYVRAELREKILACAERLGYEPDPVAQSLRLGYKQEVVVVSHSVDELHMARIAGMEASLRESGYALSVVMATDAEIAAGVKLAEAVCRGKPRGVAVLGRLGLPVTSLVREIEARRMPVVVLDTNESVPAVLIDRPAGVEEAVNHLIGRGRRCIAYVGPSDSIGRIEGYRRALAAAGGVERLLDPGTLERYRSAVGELLRRYPKLDAIQAYSDECALLLLAGLHELGVRVPHDVAVIGFDDRWAAQYAWPPLTTVAQPSGEIGAAAARYLTAGRSLDERADTTAGDRYELLVPTRLVVRESS
jgi:DNA-binding LacI/PurR family transcriptional regulator